MQDIFGKGERIKFRVSVREWDHKHDCWVDFQYSRGEGTVQKCTPGMVVVEYGDALLHIPYERIMYC